MKTHRHTVVQTHDGRPCIVTQNHFMMLDYVRNHPGAMYEEVASHVGYDKASVNTYASLMEKAGLLMRTRVHIDGRMRVQLTLEPGVVLDFDIVRLKP